MPVNNTVHFIGFRVQQYGLAAPQTALVVYEQDVYEQNVFE